VRDAVLRCWKMAPYERSLSTSAVCCTKSRFAAALSEPSDGYSSSVHCAGVFVNFILGDDDPSRRHPWPAIRAATPSRS
jgi:hypothetical protein